MSDSSDLTSVSQINSSTISGMSSSTGVHPNSIATLKLYDVLTVAASNPVDKCQRQHVFNQRTTHYDASSYFFALTSPGMQVSPYSSLEEWCAHALHHDASSYFFASTSPGVQVSPYSSLEEWRAHALPALGKDLANPSRTNLPDHSVSSVLREYKFPDCMSNVQANARRDARRETQTMRDLLGVDKVIFNDNLYHRCEQMCFPAGGSLPSIPEHTDTQDNINLGCDDDFDDCSSDTLERLLDDLMSPPVVMSPPVAAIPKPTPKPFLPRRTWKCPYGIELLPYPFNAPGFADLYPYYLQSVQR